MRDKLLVPEAVREPDTDGVNDTDNVRDIDFVPEALGDRDCVELLVGIPDAEPDALPLGEADADPVSDCDELLEELCVNA